MYFGVGIDGVGLPLVFVDFRVVTNSCTLSFVMGLAHLNFRLCTNTFPVCSAGIRRGFLDNS